ncbi:MAG: GIY-YIG nuclease family protein, partial [Candidatus Eisenbacteria bacterium]
MKRKKGRWSVYIVECADSTLYTGVAVSVPDRILAHNAGRGARYTRGRLPVELRFRLDGLSRAEAHRCEGAIKRLGREGKMRLIGGGPP